MSFKDIYEMSRYIDIEKYNAVERTHPFYEDMIVKILEQVRRFKNKGRKTKVLEIGAGTGLLTERLIEILDLQIDALEIDRKCCEFLLKKFDRSVNIIQGDGVAYCREGFYGIVVSSFAHDHIPYNRRFDFAKNIRRNLRLNGVYIMGGELLPKFSNEEERKQVLRGYHSYIIYKAIQEGHEEVASLELEALKSGLNMVGDFKRHPKMLEEEIKVGGLNVSLKQKIGPSNKEEVGGIYVYVFQKAEPFLNYKY